MQFVKALKQSHTGFFEEMCAPLARARLTHNQLSKETSHMIMLVS